MNWFKNLKRDTLLYGGLIITFIVLYGATAFVSFYHAIDLFLIGNAIFLAIILSFVAEIGQASALFSILLTKNKHKFLTWGVMIILTTLQVIGNVYASYDFIDKHNAAGVASFQKAILFFMPTADPEIFKVIIAWILGALLPIIALSMTALVAQNMILRAEEAKTNLDEVPIDPIPADLIISEVSKVRPTEEEMNELTELLNKKKPIEKVPPEEAEIPSLEIKKEPLTEEKKPSNEWRVKDGTLHPDHQKFLDEENAKPDEAQDINPSQFKSPGVFTREPMEESEAEEKRANRPDTSDEIHEEWTKMYDEINKEQEEVPPPDQLTHEEVIPHYSDEEIDQMNQDEYERMGSYNEDEEEAKKVVSEVGDPPIIITHQNGLVDGIVGTQNMEPPIEEARSPIPNTTAEEEEKKRQEAARLDRIRRIAKEQEELKKK
jgi:hypothetical protein